MLIPALFGLTSCTTTTVTRMNEFRMKKNVVYKTVHGFEVTAELYSPRLPGLKPAVLVVHGGGWDSHAGDMHEICDDLAGSGFVVFNVAYRLAPQFLYPASVEDVRDALKFMRTHAADYEIDPEQISAWGYSAGAHLVLLVGLDPTLNLKSIVAGGTPSNFSAWPVSPIIGKYIGKPLPEARAVWEGASPVNHVRPRSPPVFLYHAKNDQLVEIDQMYMMRDALKAKNVEVKTYEIPFLGHITTYLFSVRAIKEGIEFINAHTSRQSLPSS